MTGWTKALGAATAAVAGITGYRAIRPHILNWGATPEEAECRLPGDDLLAHREGVATRAITIDAPPTAVYPWLVQIGPAPRGGAYTYDWIENLLGLNMHSTEEIIEEFQHPEIGEEIEFGPNRMCIRIADPPTTFVTQSADGNWVWAFIVRPTAEGGTRLLSRNSYHLPTLQARIAMIPMESGSLVMERKMLLGIKERAERRLH